MNDEWFGFKEITTELNESIDVVNQVKTKRLILEYNQRKKKKYEGVSNHPNLNLNACDSFDFTEIEKVLEKFLDNNVKVTIKQK